jgi:hypothetical protein
MRLRFRALGVTGRRRRYALRDRGGDASADGGVVSSALSAGPDVSSKRFFQAPIVEPSYSVSSDNVVGPPSGHDAVRPI